jgi:hypothetical protein
VQLGIAVVASETGDGQQHGNRRGGVSETGDGLQGLLGRDGTRRSARQRPVFMIWVSPVVIGGFVCISETGDDQESLGNSTRRGGVSETGDDHGVSAATQLAVVASLNRRQESGHPTIPLVASPPWVACVS